MCVRTRAPHVRLSPVLRLPDSPAVPSPDGDRLAVAARAVRRRGGEGTAAPAAVAAPARPRACGSGDRAAVPREPRPRARGAVEEAFRSIISQEVRDGVRDTLRASAPLR